MDDTKKVKHPPSVLMTRTQELLREAPASYLEIYKQTNLAPNWLTAFVNGKIPDPSVNRVECLYTYLSGAPLVIG